MHNILTPHLLSPILSGSISVELLTILILRHCPEWQFWPFTVIPMYHIMACYSGIIDPTTYNDFCHTVFQWILDIQVQPLLALHFSINEAFPCFCYNCLGNISLLPSGATEDFEKLWHWQSWRSSELQPSWLQQHHSVLEVLSGLLSRPRSVLEWWLVRIHSNISFYSSQSRKIWTAHGLVLVW